MKKTLLFDLDGTLIDTNQLIIDTFYAVFQKYLPQIAINDDRVLSFIGPTLDQTFHQFVTTDEEVEALVQAYRQINKEKHDAYVRPFDHVKEVLDVLKQTCHIAVVTSKRTDMAKRGLSVCGLEGIFDVILGYEHVKAHKPDPEVIYKALEALGVEASKDVYMIGDNPEDILAAKNANVISVGVIWSLKREKLVLLKPDYMLSSMKDLLTITKEG